MLVLLMYVLILGVVAFVINALPIHETFKMIAWAIIAIFLIILLFQALGTGLPALR
jgi:hypothetical protein